MCVRHRPPPSLPSLHSLLLASYHSEVDQLPLERLGDWDHPLNKANEVRPSRSHCRI